MVQINSKNVVNFCVQLKNNTHTHTKQTIVYNEIKVSYIIVNMKGEVIYETMNTYMLNMIASC